MIYLIWALALLLLLIIGRRSYQYKQWVNRKRGATPKGDFHQGYGTSAESNHKI